jgi:tetratricopeptide (TPR) repeat protein
MAARERAAHIVEKVARSYQRYFAIEPYLWEYEPMLASGHFQDAIDPPRNFDIVILILESRLGTPLPEQTSTRAYHGMDGRTPVTGTEWEFEDALSAARGCGTPDLLVYRSKRDASVSTWDPKSRQAVLSQLEALDAFWSRHFADQGRFILAFEKYEDLEDFSLKLEKDLRRCIEQRIASLSGEAKAVTKLWPHEPFRGLEAYDLEHWPIFFGRDEAIGSAMLRLVTGATSGRPFLLVVGASGAGKSSLVKAGIVHELLMPHRVSGAAFLRRISFRASDMRPGEDVFNAFARVLTTGDGPEIGLPEMTGPSISVQDVANHLRHAEAHPELPFAMALEQLAISARERGTMLRYEQGNLLVILDQLEEMFTGEHIKPSERIKFMNLISALIRSGRIWVLATIRADFWHRAVEIPELVELSDGTGRFDLLPPSPAEINQMIKGPADAAQLSFERSQTGDIPLSDLIAQDAAGEPGALPLLSYLLGQLYQKDILDGKGHELTYASYEALGGLKGAIATRAEAVTNAQPPDVRASLRQVLFSLVQMTVTDLGIDRSVARRTPLSAFPPGTPKRLLVDAFLEPSARLLVADAGGPSATIRLAHEALISEWKEARRYVAENAGALRLRRIVEQRYARWREVTLPAGNVESSLNARTHKLLDLRVEPDAGLLTDLDLVDAQRLLRDYHEELAPELIDFVRRSIDRDNKRKRRALRIAASLAATFVVLTLVASVGWLYARQMGSLAALEANVAGRTTQFMVSIFDSANPETNRGAAVTVKEALDRSASSIQHAEQLDPRVKSALLTAMGQAYTGLGVYPTAEDLLSRAREQERVASVPYGSQIQTLVASGTAAYMAGNYPQAVKMQTSAVSLARGKLNPSDVLRSQALTGLADAQIAQGSFKEAIQLCNEALPADRKRSGEYNAVLANTLNTLGTAYFFTGALKEAEDSYREALKLREGVFTLNHTRTAESLNNLASVHYQMGRYDEARKEFQRALPIYKQIYGDEHPELAALLNNLGRSELMAGRVSDAEPFLRQALAMTQKFEGKDHDDLVPTLNSLAMIDAYRGNFQAARDELGWAERIACNQDHSDLLDQVLLNDADLNAETGAIDTSTVLLEESKKVLQRNYPTSAENAWRVAVWDSVNAELIAARGNPSAAISNLKAAEKVISDRYGPLGFYTMLAEHREQLVTSGAIRAHSNAVTPQQPGECHGAN